MTASRKYPLELRERAVRLYFESGGRPACAPASQVNPLGPTGPAGQTT